MEKPVREDCADLLYQCTTTNGAMAYSSSGDKCLDLFFIAGAMRYHDLERINMKFTEAYRENPELAMKLLFYIRDIRGGLGERDVFRRLIRTVAKKWPESALKNVHWIVEYGRWDDILCLFDLKNPDLTSKVAETVSAQLARDVQDMVNHKSVSLCAKWMPSINTSSTKTKAYARILIREMGIRESDYRKLLSSLRGYIDILERRMSAKDYTFDYSKLPSKALMKHIKAFIRNDNERYLAYKSALASGDVKAKTKAVYPYEIINVEDEDLRESMWRDIERHPGESKTIVVRDGSGSMTYSQISAGVTPLDVATSLAILFSEQLTGDFKDKFICMRINI